MCFARRKPGRCSGFPCLSAIPENTFGSCCAHSLSPLRAPVADGLSLLPSPIALSGTPVVPLQSHHALL